MLVQFAVSSGLILAMVVVHGIGLALLAQVVRSETREEHTRHLTPLSPRGMVFTVIIVFGLFALHGIEIWSFALFYLAVMVRSDTAMRRSRSNGGWWQRSRGSRGSSCLAGRPLSSSACLAGAGRTSALSFALPSA